MSKLFMHTNTRLQYRIGLLVAPTHGALADDALRCCAYDLRLWLRKKTAQPAAENPALLLLEGSFDALPQAATQFMQKLRSYSDVFPISLIRLDLVDASLLKMDNGATGNARGGREDLFIDAPLRRGMCSQA